MPEAEGGAGELDRDRRVDLRFVACVSVDAIADELRQELGVGDVCEFRRDDGARFLVELAPPQFGCASCRRSTCQLCSRTNST